jgi:hypothetical protein
MKLVPPAGATGLVSCSASGRAYFINGCEPIEIELVDLLALLRAGFTHVNITDAVAGLTDRVVAYTAVKKVSNMDRLKEKLAQAAQVAPRSAAKIMAAADALIAREADMDNKRTQAFAPHHAVLDTNMRSMDNFEDSLKVMSNSDPLESSGDTSEVEDATKVEAATEHK